jgi:periplasmic protein TonB
MPGSDMSTSRTSNSDPAIPNGNGFFASVTLESRAHTNPWAVGTSTAVNGALIALLLVLGIRTRIAPFGPNPTHSPISLTDFPLLAPVAPQSSNGGSGAGSHDLVDPMRGNPPQVTTTPLSPPIIPVVNDPKLAVESALAKQTVTLPSDPSLPNIGILNSPDVSIASDGPGGPAGMGAGHNGTYGNGTGHNVYGPGDGLIPGNGVTAPLLIYAPTPEFSDEARRNKYQGVCTITVVVDAQGIPRNPVVVQRLGEGLDEKALEAIRLYKFKPGMKDGRAVPTRITIAVNFRLF